MCRDGCRVLPDTDSGREPPEDVKHNFKEKKGNNKNGRNKGMEHNRLFLPRRDFFEYSKDKCERERWKEANVDLLGEMHLVGVILYRIYSFFNQNSKKMCKFILKF